MEKVVCRPRGDGVATAPSPGKVIEGGIPGPGLLASIVVDKYRDGLPLYRQADRFKRAGFEIARSTLVGWVAQAARVLGLDRRTLYRKLERYERLAPPNGG